MTKRKTLFLLGALVTCALVLSRPISAAEASRGSATVTGRIQNAMTGQSLNNARITIKGTDLVAFTDETGRYRLTNVPEGSAVLEIFYTGMAPQQVVVSVAAKFASPP